MLAHIHRSTHLHTPKASLEKEGRIWATFIGALLMDQLKILYSEFCIDLPTI